MKTNRPRTTSVRARPRVRYIVLAMAAILPACPVLANILVVTSCTDAAGDNGSLRSTIVAAAESDTVDLSTLQCPGSVITLTQGVIPVSVGDLTLSGSSTSRLTISGDNLDRVVEPTLAGTLTIDNLTIEKGSFTTPAFSFATNVAGGCIYSLNGSVSLNNSTVTGCSMITDTGRTGVLHNGGARGGAISAAHGSVTLSHSVVSNSFVDSVDPNYSTAGGCIAADSLFASYSVINGCVAIGGAGANSEGGGAFVSLAGITASALYNNASNIGGALEIEGGALATSTIYNSTLSGNSAASGGAIDSTNPIDIGSSTIAFNRGAYVAGIYLEKGTLTLNSVIVSNNMDPNGNLRDLSIGSGSMTGAKNIITHFIGTTPPGVITADPQLAPLAFHGGPTPTHAFNPTSPALNAGSNLLSFHFDQRATGFLRTVGSSTDIGSYENQGLHDDEIFYSGFTQ